MAMIKQLSTNMMVNAYENVSQNKHERLTGLPIDNNIATMEKESSMQSIINAPYVRVWYAESHTSDP